MSRSTKAPWATQKQKKNNNTKVAKRLANKRVRQAEVASGGDFHKVSESWDISDWSLPDTSPKGTRK